MDVKLTEDDAPTAEIEALAAVPMFPPTLMLDPEIDTEPV
jgi:hypothetical protein